MQLKVLARLALISVLMAPLSRASAAPFCAQLMRVYAPLNHLNPHLEDNTFTINRSLNAYFEFFKFRRTADLKATLEQLDNNSTWFDMGAGSAHALAEGLKAYSHIEQGIAVAFKRPSSSGSDLEAERSGRLKYLEGSFVEELASRGELKQWIGKVDLITDVFGPLSYSKDFAQVIEIYTQLLKPGGELFFTLMISRDLSQSIVNSTIDAKGQIDAGGLLYWLLEIPGLRTKEVTVIETTSGLEKSYTVKVQKIDDSVTIPNNLINVDYQSGSPPQRSFKLDQ